MNLKYLFINKNKKIRLSIKLVLMIFTWIVLTIFTPIFENHPHYPSALFAPIFGFFAIFDGNAWESNSFYDTTVPWICFWLAIFAIIFFDKKSNS